MLLFDQLRSALLGLRPRQPAPATFAGPLALLGTGLLLGVWLVPGRAPAALTWVSWGVVFGLYALAACLARRGWGGWVVVAAVAVVLGLAPLAFGPSPLDNRKITVWNDWAFQLGAHLPPIFAPPPHPNGLAAGLAAGLGMLGAVTLAGPRRWRVLACGVVAMLAGLLLLTVSRAGWVAAGAAGLVLVSSYARRGVAWLLAGGLAVVVALTLISGPPLPGQPALDSTESLGQRATIWGLTLDLLAPHPWTGLGLARFPATYAARVAASGQDTYTTPHNLLLEVWSDAGLCGLLALAWTLVRAARLARRPATPGAAWLHTGAVAALVAVAAHGLFEVDVAIVWARADGSFGYLANPLPFVLLGLLAGTSTASDSGQTTVGSEQSESV